VQKLADRYQESAREWVLGLHWGRLDDRITELFFEKSVGQHIHEGTTLAVLERLSKLTWKFSRLLLPKAMLSLAAWLPCIP